MRVGGGRTGDGAPGVVLVNRLANVIGPLAAPKTIPLDPRHLQGRDAIAVHINGDGWIHRRRARELVDRRNLPTIEHPAQEAVIAFIFGQLPDAADVQPVRTVARIEAVALEEVVQIDDPVPRSVARVGVGGGDLVTVREAFVELEVQAGVTRVGAGLINADGSVRALRFRVESLRGGADRDDARRDGSWNLSSGIDRYDADAVEAVVVDFKNRVRPAERDPATHDEVRRHHHIPHDLALHSRRVLDRVGSARAVVENLAARLEDLDVADGEVFRRRIIRRFRGLDRREQIDYLLPGQRAAGRRRSRRELLQELWLPRLAEQRIRNRRAGNQHPAIAPGPDQPPLLNASEAEVGIVVEHRPSADHGLLLLAERPGEADGRREEFVLVGRRFQAAPGTEQRAQIFRLRQIVVADVVLEGPGETVIESEARLDLPGVLEVEAVTVVAPRDLAVV